MPSSIFSSRYSAVVEVLSQARRTCGVTQAELARRLDRHQSYVSKVERRERRVDPVEFYDWGEALGLDPASLFDQLASRMGAGQSKRKT